MKNKDLGNLIGGTIVSTILILILVSILKWLELLVGKPSDWIIGVVGFWWLLIVVTIPWNIYFKSREILDTAQRSENKKINKTDIKYAQNLKKYSLLFALLLHFTSSAVFYLLAYYQITVIGYPASVIALLLTLLRPLIRAYYYLNEQLSTIEKNINYPEDNVFELKNKVNEIEKMTKNLFNRLNTDDETSWASDLEKKIDNNNKKNKELSVKLNEYNEKNIIEHNKISKESKDAISQLTIDGEFLNHIREIIRFFKKA